MPYCQAGPVWFVQVRMLRTLQAQRELLDIPPGSERFRTYLGKMLQGTQDVVLPLVQANPMAKEGLKAHLDGWLELDADGRAQAIAEGAAAELGLPLSCDGAVVLIDDEGGWTSASRVDHDLRFASKYNIRKGFAVANLHSSDPVDGALLRHRVRAAVARYAWQKMRGLPDTLEAMLEQEGAVLRFAGWHVSTTQEQQDHVAKLTQKLAKRWAQDRRGSEPLAHHIAILYGDAAAAKLGYEKLGVVPNAAWDWAVQAQESKPALATQLLAED